MKTKTVTKSKPRSKAAKVAYLKRSAAGKAVHHRKRIQHHAKWHIRIAVVLALFGVGVGVALAASADDLRPPASNDPRLDVYIRAAQAKAEANRQAAQGNKAPDQIGIASWYALGLPNPDALTCASTKFPRGTYLRVKDLRNGREVVCLVNDYGPQPGTRRVIDLSRGSYRQLEGLGSGTLPAEIRVAPAPSVFR